MREKLSFTGVLFFLMLHHSTVAQTSLSFSDFFDQFYNNYYLLNPANTDTSYQIAAKVANKAQTGLFQGVNKIYMDVDLRVSPKKNVIHFAGIQIINNREGDYISKNRLLGRYSLRIKTSERSSLSAGLALGFVNYAFNTSQAGVGGSAWVPDGNAGLWYLRKKLSLGFSMQQMFSQRIRPVDQTFILDNYFNFTAKYSQPINYFLNINSHFYSKFQKGQPAYFVLASLFEIQEKFDAGVSYSYLRGLSGVVGIKQLSMGKSRFSFYFSYFLGTGNVMVSDNAFELLLSYHR